MTKEERNRKIAIAVLSGFPVSKVASEFGISPTTVGQIVRKFCFSKDRDVYRCLKKNVQLGKNPTIKQLRENTDAFLYQCDENEILMLESPIYKIKDFPSYLITALESWGVKSIGDLFMVDLNDLKKRAPMIGVLAIKKIETFLKKNEGLLES